MSIMIAGMVHNGTACDSDQWIVFVFTIIVSAVTVLSLYFYCIKLSIFWWYFDYSVYILTVIDCIFTVFWLHICFGKPGTPRTSVPRWQTGKHPSEMRGRREIKYLPRNKQAWQWAVAFAITNCRWKSRSGTVAEGHSLTWDTYCQNGRTTKIIKHQLWVNSLADVFGETKARGVNLERNSRVKPLRWTCDKTDTLLAASAAELVIIILETWYSA